MSKDNYVAECWEYVLSNACIRLIVCIGNIAFILSGLGITGIGIWIKVDKDSVAMQQLIEVESGDSALTTAAYILIGFGLFLTLLSAAELIGMCCDKTRFLNVYIGLTFIILVGEIVSWILFAVYKGKIKNEISEIMKKTFDQYKPGHYLLAKSWDYLQTLLDCCGANGPEDYRAINFTIVETDHTMYVPKSCCALSNNDPENPKPNDPLLCQFDALSYDSNFGWTNSTNATYAFLKTKGCFDGIMDEMSLHAGTVYGICIGVMVFQLLCIIGTCGIKREIAEDK